MKKDLYFTVCSYFELSLLNKLNPDDTLTVKINVFEYHSDTNHPTDLGAKHYYKYSHSLVFLQNGAVQRKKQIPYKEIIIGCADYRIMPDTEEKLIEMVQRKLNIKPVNHGNSKL